MVKVYVFKLKNEESIYAYTIENEYAKMFREQRNMDLFNEIKLKMDEEELKIFSYEVHAKQLTKDYLDDNGCTIEIVSSIYESAALSESTDYILYTMQTIENRLYEYPLKEKYLKIIKKITKSITNTNDDNILNINTFALFYHLFRKTFSEYAQDEELNSQFNPTFYA